VIIVSRLPDGVSEMRICGSDRMVGGRATVHDGSVTMQETHSNHASAPIAGGRSADTTVLLSAADFDALLDELAALRAAVEGSAGPGSVVTVSDRAGRTWEYQLVQPHDPRIKRQQAALDMPIAKALLGAKPGDSVQLTLGNGRRRRVRVLEVSPPDPRSAPAAAAASAP
jgi:hypothetical protein